MTKAWTPLETWSVPRGAHVALSQDGLDDTAQAAHRAAAPVARDSGMPGTIERWHPALVQTAFLGEVRNHGGQEVIATLTTPVLEGQGPPSGTETARRWVQGICPQT